MKTILLSIAGVVVGLIGWALCGIGLTELGVLTRFDPVGVSTDLPDATTVETIIEWSYPVWCLLGAVTLPRFVRWALGAPENNEPRT